MFSLAKKACLYFFCGFVIVLALGFAWRFFATPFMTKVETSIIVPPHSTIKQVAVQLHERGLLSNPGLFIAAAHLHGDADKLRAGEYAITPHMTPDELLTNMAAGKVLMRKITLVEGITMTQIRQVFLSSPGLVRQAVLQTDAEMMAAIGHPGQPCEGHFFPDTYLYTWGNKDTRILQRAYHEMDKLLMQEWGQRDGGLPYKTPEEALITASLIESEAAMADERMMIAGVIVRRLEKRMPLQIDPTVLYGVHKPFGSEITVEDLHNDNPYNTYLHYGLPPTAINMPGVASIRAAMHPMPGNALYYVAKGDGSHQFSATYSEHLKAVKQYREYEKKL